MRPDISDSFSSGKPLYLLYSKPSGFAGLVAPFVAAISASFAAHATGRVRLQVTGKPPTTSDALFFSEEHAANADGNAIADASFNSCRRVRKLLSRLSMPPLSSPWIT